MGKRPNWQTWSDSADKKWRSSFTREEKMGDRKFRHDLRHKSAAEIVLGQKKAMYEKGPVQSFYYLLNHRALDLLSLTVSVIKVSCLSFMIKKLGC